MTGIKQNGGIKHRDARGVKGDMSASEILTLMIAHDYLPYPGENASFGTHPGELFRFFQSCLIVRNTTDGRGT